MDGLAKRQSRDCPTGFQWYSCNLVGDTFTGCCAVDPCNPNGGCPATALPPTSSLSTAPESTTLPGSGSITSISTIASATTLSTPGAFSTSSSGPIIASKSTALSTPVPAASTTQSTVVPASTTSKAAKRSGAPVGAIVGGVIGGLLALFLALAIAALIVYRRRRRQAQLKSATITRRKSMEPVHGDEGESMFAPFGGFYRGVDEQHAEKTSSADDGPLSESNGHTYESLDNEAPESSPGKNRISQLDGSPISELADTSPAHPHGFTAQPQYIAYSPARHSARVSPITPTDGDDTRRHHAMSWHNYNALEADSPPSRLTSNVAAKTSDVEDPDPRRGTWS